DPARRRLWPADPRRDRPGAGPVGPTRSPPLGTGPGKSLPRSLLGKPVRAADAVGGHTKITKEAKLAKGHFRRDEGLGALGFLRDLGVTKTPPAAPPCRPASRRQPLRTWVLDFAGMSAG